MVWDENLTSAHPQRTTPRTSFENDDRSPHALHPKHPPHTPPSRGTRAAGGKGAARTRNRPALRETFSGDNARADANQRGRNRSDSHDLSWSPKNTRDSVVDNMLLSLDQLFVGDAPPASVRKNDGIYSAFNEETAYTASPHQPSLPRGRGYTFSSSMSSDYSLHAPEATSPQSIRSPRGRRSNSSSNFQSALGRIDSVRAEDEEGTKSSRGKLSDAQRAPLSDDRAVTSRPSRRKGSKGSGSSSLDFGPMMGGPRWQRAIERRSSSFDHGLNSRAVLVSEPHTVIRARIEPAPSPTFPYDNYESAPEPTIPAGPRRDHSPQPAATFPLSSIRNGTQPNQLRRKSSKRSAATLFSRHDKAVPSGTTSQTHSQYRAHTRTNSRDLPPTPSFGGASDQVFPVSDHKLSVVSSHNSSTAGKEKDKPGFFRRVFGSAKSPISNAGESPASYVPLASTRSSTRADSRNEQVPIITPTAKLSRSGNPIVPPKDNSKEMPPATLNKKSSFFRRRKKSVSADMPIPVLPLQLQSQMGQRTRLRTGERSPVSSLREVMNPYLSSSVPTHYKPGSSGLRDFNYPAVSPESLAVPNPSTTRSVPKSPRTVATTAVTDRSLAPSPERESFDIRPPDAVAPPLRPTGQESKVSSNAQTLHTHPQRNDIVSEPLSSYNTNLKPRMSPNKESVQVTPNKNHNRSQSADKDLPKLPLEPTPLPTVNKKTPDPSGLANAPTGTTSKERGETPPRISSKELSDLPKRTSSKELAPLPVRTSSKKSVDLPIRTSSKDQVEASTRTMVKQMTDAPVRTTSKDWISVGPPLTPNQIGGSSPRPSSNRSTRVWIQPTKSEEELQEAKLSLPRERITESARASDSSISEYRSASSNLHTPVIGADPESPRICAEPEPIADVPEPETVAEAPEPDTCQPTQEEAVRAKRIYDGEDEIVDKANSAAWLGDAGKDRGGVRKAYMDLFDWQNLNLLVALRDLCGRLLLKGETQQIDRILEAFSTRWCNCNPNHGFKAEDVIHTICYSVLLLNTDLHMADIEKKMTRSEFIKNTMPTIRRVAADAAPGAFDLQSATLSPLRNELSPSQPLSSNAKSATFPRSRDPSPASEPRRPIHRLSMRVSDHAGNDSASGNPFTPLDYETPVDDCGPLVKAPFHGKMSTWEVQVEIVLKDFYNSIRQQRLPLFGSDESEKSPESAQTSNSLSTFASGMLRRTPSMLSKAESQSTRGRLNENRLGAGRWASKTRSRPRMYPAMMVASSRSSFDDESSAMSPSASSTWSKYSLGKTQTSMSVNSFASSFLQGDYQQSIGFANALSQAIIREEAVGDNAEENLRVAPLIEDESLELAGAPWAKEGILKHKHHLEAVDKKAKDRNWNECFAVVEKGWMRLFQFNMNAKSMRLKAKHQKLPGGVVGGGNWTENAEALGTFLLRQTIASALPPPGYSKTRPHVWALSLPTGAVHLFNVGTPEIVKEFVTTANYWSARLSKEPLVGGVSNIEYGWSDMVINMALLSMENRPPSTGPRPSLQSSIRSSIDQGGTRPRLPGDRVVISDWNPPQQSMMASALMEVDQLKALTAYVKNIEDELQKHNELRSAMLLAFTPRHINHTRAMANWERKSSYLLREIVKFRTYIDCLQAAQMQKEKIYAERAASAKVDEPMETTSQAEEKEASAPLEKESSATGAESRKI